jgi:NADH:ubiquinone oxidoreductase subunit H
LLLAVAYSTLSERKILAVSQSGGKGLIKLDHMDYFEPIADGSKLLLKEVLFFRFRHQKFFFEMSPVIAFSLALFSNWSMLPFPKAFGALANIDSGYPLYFYYIISFRFILLFLQVGQVIHVMLSLVF